MPKVILIQGSSGSGKTTLIEKLIQHYTVRHFSIGVIKSYAHELKIDADASKDSSKFHEAGAQKILMHQLDQHTLFSYQSPLSLNQIIPLHFSDFDLVFAEGFVNESTFPRIMLMHESLPLKAFTNIQNILCFVADKPCIAPVPSLPVFTLPQLDAVIELIDQIPIEKPHCFLLINGKKVPMNHFVEDILTNTLLGLVHTIKHEDDEIQSVQLFISTSPAASSDNTNS